MVLASSSRSQVHDSSPWDKTAASLLMLSAHVRRYVSTSAVIVTQLVTRPPATSPDQLYFIGLVAAGSGRSTFTCAKDINNLSNICLAVC
jgi:hypothetical protein